MSHELETGERALFHLSLCLFKFHGKVLELHVESSFTLGRSGLGAWAASPALFLPCPVTKDPVPAQHQRRLMDREEWPYIVRHRRADISALWK